MSSSIVLSETNVITQAYSAKLRHQCHHDYVRVCNQFLTIHEGAYVVL